MRCVALQRSMRDFNCPITYPHQALDQLSSGAGEEEAASAGGWTVVMFSGFVRLSRDCGWDVSWLGLVRFMFPPGARELCHASDIGL